MTGRATIRMVAERAEVSVATVSYVLSGRAGGNTRISAATRRRVVAAADALGYVPNRQAQSMRTGRTHQVCLVLRHPHTPWSRAMAQEVSGTLGPAGFSTLILVDGDWETFLLRGGADGAVIEASADAVPRLEALAARGVSLVVHGAGALEPRGFDAVVSDESAACAAAMDLLTSRHRRVACLGGTDGARHTAYLQGLARAGLPVDPGLVRFTGPSREVAYRAAIDLLSGADRPGAIFAQSDLAAMAALWAAHRLGVAVPGELEIVGAGNTPEGAAADPPLTSAGPEAIFATIAGLLLSRLSGEASLPRVRAVPWTLHERATTLP
ncbi:LacI family DNA-binding transcriptional regulator [Nonomuraea longicatena]